MSNKSFVYARKSKRPRIDPCGTLAEGKRSCQNWYSLLFFVNDFINNFLFYLRDSFGKS